MASRTVARQKHGGKDSPVLTIDFDALHRDWAAIKASRHVDPPGCFTAAEYAAKCGLNLAGARARLLRMKREGLVQRREVWRNGRHVHGWQVAEKEKK